MKQRFLETGIPTSKFFLIGKGNKRYKSCDLSFPLVVKPADANSSKGITKVWDNTELINAIDNALKFSRSEEAVVEEFKNGDELSVDVAIQNRKALVLLVTKNIKAKTNAKNFTIIQNSYPATYNPVIIRKIHKTAEKLAEIYGIKNGLFLIQFISKGNSLSVIECTARIGGGGKHHFIKKLTGFDILEHYINLLIDNPVGIRIDYKYRYASMNYIYTYPGIIKEFAGFYELIQRKIIMDWQFYKTQGMKITGHISSNDRAGGFLIMDNDMTGLQQKILTADSTLKILDSKNEDIMMHGLYKYGDY
jgi:biotin carboxylase